MVIFVILAFSPTLRDLRLDTSLSHIFFSQTAPQLSWKRSLFCRPSRAALSVAFVSGKSTVETSLGGVFIFYIFPIIYLLPNSFFSPLSHKSPYGVIGLQHPLMLLSFFKNVSVCQLFLVPSRCIFAFRELFLSN